MNFEVDRHNFRQTRVVENDPPPLEPGQIRMTVERFAVTSNNVSYAVAGDALDYWGFFPTEPPFGRIPAMGLGSVTESNHPEIEVGGRYFGFYPMADHHIVSARTRRDGFRDVGAHRAKHAAVYTDFVDVTTEAMFRDDLADEYLLLRGLFTTSFLADDFLADNDFHGATQTLVTSASSKTSISLAHCLAKRDHHCVGLTSGGNRAFVDSLGLYDQVITYDQITDLDPAIPSVVVDMAGNPEVRKTVHTHFDDQLKFSSMIGTTHWEEFGGLAGIELPGPTPEFFFAPSQIAKRSKDWGADELMSRIAGSLLEMMEGAGSWLTVEHHHGADGIAEVYSRLLEGRADPSVGFVVFPAGHQSQG